MKILKVIGDRAGERAASGNLANAYCSLGVYQKALEYHGQKLKLQKKSVIGPEKDEPMEVSLMLKARWVTVTKPLSIMKKVSKLHKRSLEIFVMLTRYWVMIKKPLTII